MSGSGDCEARVGEWGQQALLISSGAYVLIGILLLVWYANWGRFAGASRMGTLGYAAGLVVTGLGSMDYHGPVWGPEPLLHDTGLAFALVVAVGINLRQLGIRRMLAAGGLVVLSGGALGVMLISPGLSATLAAIAVAGLVVTEALIARRGLRQQRRNLYAALACLAIGGVVYSLSRTGGALCDPESWLQGHGVWHVLTAAALGLWGLYALPGSAARAPAAVDALQ